MPVYRYKAVDANGKTISHSIAAKSLHQAKQQLTQASLVVFELAEEREKKSVPITLKLAQKTLWVRQLATLINAGYTLEKALSSCGRQSQDGQLIAFSKDVHQRVSEGLPFHKVLGDYPKAFDSTFCATIQAGESSGYLDAVLERLADHAEASEKMRSAIRQALIYPVILTVVATLLIAYLMTAVIPDVVRVFRSGGQELPTVTQWLLMISHFLGRYGFILLGLIISFFWLLKRWLFKEKNRLKFHSYLLKMPLLGQVLSGYYVANFSATLAILLNAGVKLIDALKISTQTLSNTALRKIAEHASEEVQKGRSLAQSLQSKSMGFPGMLLELIDSGERTGQLAHMLDKASSIYHRQSQSQLNTLTSLLGPIMILIMGGIIFVIVLAILLPIFDLNQTIK